MALMLTDVGAEMILGAYFNGTFPGPGTNLYIHLYNNNHAPVDTDGTGAFTETTVTGGSGKTLAQGGWTVSITSSIAQVQWTAGALTWTFTANFGDTIYGYYIVDQAASPNLIWAELLTAAFTPANNGDQVLITPRFQSSHGTPTT